MSHYRKRLLAAPVVAGAITLAVTGPGSDGVQGADGDDRIHGGPGDEGDDRIIVRDGQRDVVTCGPGFDRVLADAADSVAADCEAVRVKTG